MYRILFSLFILFSIFLKYVELGNTSIGIYQVILGIALLLIVINVTFGKKNNIYNKEFYKISRPLIYFIGYIILQFLIYQGRLIEVGLSLRLVLIYIMGIFLYATTYGLLHFKNVTVQWFMKFSVIISAISSVTLLGQTIFNLNFTGIEYLKKLGLADPNESLVHALDLIYKRGTGIGLTVTDFASHNFIPIFFIILYLFKSSSGKKIILGISGAIILLAIYINGSSASILALFAGTFMLLFRRVSLSRLIFIGFIIGLLFIPHILVFLQDVSLAGQSVYGSPIVSRLYIWSKAISIFLLNPVFGVGLGNQLQMLSDIDTYYYINFSYGILSLHSWFFDILSALGVIGLLLYIWVLYTAFKSSTSLVRNDYRVNENNILSAGLVSYIIFGLFSNVHYMNYDIFLLFALINYNAVQFKQYQNACINA